MNTGTKVTPAAGRDRVVTGAMMAARFGFVLALLMGVVRMAGFISFGGGAGLVHMLLGSLVVGALLVAGYRLSNLGRGTTLMAVALIGGLGGAIVGLSNLSGLFHALTMVAVVGTAEAVAAKARRA